jgi:hypothetical protein
MIARRPGRRMEAESRERMILHLKGFAFWEVRRWETGSAIPSWPAA